MTVRVANGSQLHIANGYGAAIAVTAITNATTAVASATGHGLLTGDYAEVTAGWSRLNNKTVRIGAVTANTFELEGVDTTLTSIYATGSGVPASVRKISAWQQIIQVIRTGSDGGEQQYATYQLLEGDSENRIPTIKSAQGLSFGIADDPTLAGFILASAANDDRLQRSLRISLPGGSKILYTAFVSVNKVPSMNQNEVMACDMSLSLQAEVQRYAT